MALTMGPLDRAALTALALARFPNGFVTVFDAQLRCVVADGAGLQELGQSRELLEGRTVGEAFPPDVAAVLEAPYREAIEGRETVFDVAHADHVYEFRVQPLVDEGGTVIGCLGVAQNVTDLRAMEIELRESEERFETLAQQSFEAVLIHDGRQTLAVNPAFTATFGYTEDEVRGADPFMFLSPGFRKKVRANLVAHAQGPFEAEANHKDGHLVVVKGNVHEISYRGSRARVVSMHDVVSERRREADLRDAEARFRSAFDHAPIGMALVSPEGAWLRVNPALSGLLGYSEEEFLSRSFQDITHPDDLDADLEQVRRVLSGDIREYQMEKRYFRKDGSLIWIQLSVSLVRNDDGTPGYFISQIQDISARKRYEDELSAHALELKQANKVLQTTDELKSEFIAIAAHELKTPLTGVRGSIVTLRRHWVELSDEGRLELLEMADRQAERLHLLTEELLMLSRIDGGLLNVEPVDLLLDPLVGEIVDALAPDAGFVVEIGNEVRVLADRGHVRQILSNVVSNALKYGAAPFEVGARETERGVEVRFRDHGPGVEAAHVGRLFEKFSRLTSRGDVPGSGLGLAIVRGLVEANNGAVWYEDPGSGAVFAFRLPTP